MQSVEFVQINTELKNQVTIDQAWYYKIVPLKIENGVLHFTVSENKKSKDLQSELEIVLGRKVVLEGIDSEKLEQSLMSNYPKVQNNGHLNSSSNETYRLNVNDSNFLETLVKEAKDLHSSDIHIETYSEKCRIRFRVDGVLIDRHKLNKSEYPTLINKIKIAASCDIAEKRMPQDGRIRFKFNNSNLDMRVSILPTLYGEKIVLRLLGSDASHIQIEKLGFSKEELQRYELAVKKPNGIILISGPTGSGKTTTLYATLKVINKPTNNILTIEDPIEYTLDGVNQVQLKEEIGLSYTEALRTFLRQDPDIIMLGEIRDAQTAQMAIRAALTGHLVLSTIHTNSAWGTISRLVDMGIAPYLLASVMNLSVAQRLIRVLCPHCKKQEAFNPIELPKNYQQINMTQHFVSVGCQSCYFTGYKGRKAIYEVINVTRELAELIKTNVTEIDEYLKINKIDKLSENALKLFEEGETSLEEVYPFLISES
ncbi:GspE/PulE family protein [Aurantibacillus circumpalustris]|uniref:GspE/PulE family protein n=1 Tax=Aurantibacillus circumpalustris TaxID=3036359 RepID=UPI00295ACDF5|nr:GspE/PulE family protein [Aurantibacillus circumpalustris]